MASASSSNDLTTPHQTEGRDGLMLHMTNGVDDRIRELHATAAELRYERAATTDRPGTTQGLRVRVGTLLLAAGTALVSSASPASPSRAGR
jgi:hypothetical protein